jgi:hypothetical protein
LKPEFINHKGKRILRLDYSGLSLEEAMAALQQSERVIAAEPLRSVRAVTIWSARLTNQAAEAIKRHVDHNTPYIYASAVVTVNPFQKAVFEALKAIDLERLVTFNDEQQALDWLAAQ